MRGFTPRGFTIVELIVVILLISILAAVALPRFLESTDEARLKAAVGTTGSFEEGVLLLHSQWLVKGKPASDTIDGVPVDFDANGWPSSTAAGVNYCMDIWGDVFHAAEPVVPYVAGASPEAWSALRFGALCLFVYQYGEVFTGTNPLPFFIYQPLATGVNILRFNMP